MITPRNILRMIATKSEINLFNNSKISGNESSISVKKIWKNVDIQNFLRYNQNAFKNENCQSIFKEEILNKPSNKLKKLIMDENDNYIDASFIFNVNPLVDDKVNDIIRDSEIEKLCDLNTVYFELPINILCDTVSLIDRFISKVKVKPKYMSCLTAACFQLVATARGYKKNFLSLDNLANLLRCGASGQDLEHMQQIIRMKLNNSLPLITINAFIEEIDPEAIKDHRIDRILEAAVSKFLICWNRPSRVAAAVLVIYYQKTSQSHLIEGLFDMFKSEWDLIKYLIIHITDQYSTNDFTRSNKQFREPLLWIISRKTFSNIHFASTPDLETIEEEKEDSISI